MAKNKITIDIEVNGKMQKATVSAKKLRKSLADVETEQKKVAKSAGEADRNIKGAAQASANGTKNFSKMSQGMGGLVGAYATVAANVFALSAAFEFLKNAAQLEQLEKAQVSFAGSTGVALASVTQGLREASDGMLGFRESAQAAAIGVAKGFSPAQLEKLAVGARKVSAVLGRDFEDAFDRLVRGVSKAEPELLDELGITLRLETATKRYADALGLQKDQLTEAQRSQAVLLETQRQLDDQFGSIEAPTNPYIQLKKTFEDLIKDITQKMLPAFNAIADIINSSAVSAATVFGAVAFSIAKTIIPTESLNKAVANFSANAKKSYDAATEKQKEYKKSIDTTTAAAKDHKKILQSAAQAAVDAGSTSLTAGKIARGEDVSASEMGSFRNTLERAEAGSAETGTNMKGVFANVKASIIKNLNEAFTTSQQSAKVTENKFKVFFKNIALEAKIAGQAIKKGLTNGLEAAVTAGKGLVKVMGKLMSILAFVGLLDIFKEMALSITGAANKFVTSITGAIDGAFTWLVNKAAGLLDFLSAGFFDLQGKLEGKKLNPMGFLLEKSGTKGLLVEAETLVTTYKKVRAQVEAINNSIAASATDSNNIAKGLRRASEVASKRRDEGDTEGFRDAITRRNFTKIQAMATLNYSGLAKDIMDLPLEKQGAAMNDFMAAFGPVMEDLPLLANILKSANFGSAEFMDGLDELQRKAGDASANYTGFKDEIANFGAAIAGKDLTSALFMMDALRTNAEVTAKSTSEMGDSLFVMREYENVFKQFGTTSSKYRAELEGLKTTQDDLLTSSVSLGKQQIDTANILNPLDKERAQIIDKIAEAEQSHKEILQQLNNEKVMMQTMNAIDQAQAAQRIAALTGEADVAAYLLKVLRDTKQARLDAVGDKGSSNSLKAAQTRLNLEKQLLGMQQQASRLSMAASSAREKLLRYELENVLRANPNASEEQILKAKILVEKEIVKNRITAANLEYKLKIDQINMEEKLLVLRTQLAKQDYQNQVAAKEINPIEGAEKLYDDIITAAGNVASTGRAAADINRGVKVATADGALRGFITALENQELNNALDQALRKSFKDSLGDAFVQLGMGGSGKEALKNIGTSIWKGVLTEASQRASQAITDYIFGKDDPAADMKKAITDAGDDNKKKIKDAHHNGADKVNREITAALNSNTVKIDCCDGAKPKPSPNPPKPAPKPPVDPNVVANTRGVSATPYPAGEGPLIITEINTDKSIVKHKQEQGLLMRVVTKVVGMIGKLIQAMSAMLFKSNAGSSGGAGGGGMLSSLMSVFSNMGMPGGGGGAGGGGGILSSIMSVFSNMGGAGGGGGGLGGLISTVMSMFGGMGARYGGRFKAPKAMFGGILAGVSSFSNLALPGLGPAMGMGSSMLGTLTGGMGMKQMMPLILLLLAGKKMGVGRKMFRHGGVSSGMFGDGGVAKGTAAGYPAILHGTEAVVPLPNGRSIPVEMSAGAGAQNNNVNVSVNVDSNGQGSVSAEGADNLGLVIGQAVQQEIQKQKRHGGLLSPYGAR